MGYGCNSYQASKTISPEKAVEITNECVMIKEEFGLDRLAINKIAKFYYDNHELKLGNIYESLKLIVKILKSYGYDEDEVNSFLMRNRELYFNEVDDLKRKLGLFAKCGLLKEAVFTYNGYLNYHMKKHNGLTFELLHAYAEEKGYNLRMSDIDNLIGLKPEQVRSIKKGHSLNSRTLFMYEYELKRQLKKVSEETSESILKLK